MAQLLSQVAVGSIVKLNENDSPVEYLVVHQGLPSSMYDASCNGTWLLRNQLVGNTQWNTTNINTLASATIQSFLNNTILGRYDQGIQNVINHVKIPYCIGNKSSTVNSGSNGLQCQIFLLGCYEIGWTTGTNQYFPVDGAALSYFQGTSTTDSKRIAYLNGSATYWWLRSPMTNNTTNVLYVDLSGGTGNDIPSSPHGIRPAMILSGDIYVLDDGTVITTPPAPASITTPSLIMTGNSVPISWDGVEVADSYILQRKADSGEWTQVYAGSDTTYTDTAGSWSTVQYQVCGVFGSTNGAFAQSDVITVVPTSTLVISGSDGSLGTITNDIPYSVATDTGNQIAITRMVNGAQVASLTVDSGFAYNIPVMDLPTGTGTIVITATVQTSSDPVTVTRTWTYSKQTQTFPTSGGLAQLTQDGQNVFPLTLAEAVKAIGGPWGGNLASALDKLATAATYTATAVPKCTQVTVDLSTVQVGDIVDLPYNGVMVPHIVVQIGNPDPEMYDSSCDGVWLLRKDIVEEGRWNSSNANTLSGSTIMTTMQGYVSQYDSTVQAAMQTVKIPYCTGGGNTTINTLANGLQCQMFPLSGYELGWTTGTTPYLPVDGAKLSYFESGTGISANNKRIATLNGSVASWWLRSPYTGNVNGVVGVYSNGDYDDWNANNSYGVRPCFILPTTFQSTYYVDPNSGTVYAEQQYTTAGDFADLWGNVIPTVKIVTGSYVGTGTYGQSNPNTLTFNYPVFILNVGDAETGYRGYFTPPSTYINTSGASSCRATWSNNNKTVSWYNDRQDAQQLNENGVTYQYFVICI